MSARSGFSLFFPANLRWILIPLLTVWGFYWLARLAFMWKYPETVNQLTWADVPGLIWLTLRFDSSTLLSINLLFLVLLLAPFPKGRWFFTVLKVVFVLANLVFLIFNAIDVPFFAFNARRTSWPALVFLLGDSLRQLPQLLKNYWIMLPATGLMAWLLFRSFPVFPDPEKKSVWKSLGWTVLALALGIFVIRNSVKLKPLSPGEAFTLSQAEAGHAILNTPFVLFKTVGVPEISAPGWLPEKEVDAYMQPEVQPDPGPLAGRNLVLIILESFATEYTGLENGGLGYTPFLDSLARAGIWFPHHFANGRTSRDALPSVLASIPAWMEESFSSSPYLSVRNEGLGKSLKREGYQTAFFHGGKNGTMSFDLYSRLAGFDRYFGLNEYPNQGDYDGNWGIFDEPFLQFVNQELSQMQQPFAAGIFTLSSHQPYTIPKKWKGKLRKGPLPVHEAVNYADAALRGFFASAQKQPWFAQTVFVLTADHTQENSDPAYRNLPGQFDVPLIVFAPGYTFPADTARWLQHSDIAPLLRDLLLKKPAPEVNPLGRSPLGKTGFYPMEYQDGHYHLFHPEGVLSWKGDQAEADWTWAPLAGKAEPAGLRKEMMARLQFYRRGLVRDRILIRK